VTVLRYAGHTLTESEFERFCSRLFPKRLPKPFRLIKSWRKEQAINYNADFAIDLHDTSTREEYGVLFVIHRVNKKLTKLLKNYARSFTDRLDRRLHYVPDADVDTIDQVVNYSEIIMEMSHDPVIYEREKTFEDMHHIIKDLCKYLTENYHRRKKA